MPGHRRNGKTPRREFVKQSVATLGAMGTLGGAAATADPGQAAARRAGEEPAPPPRAFNGPYTTWRFPSAASGPGWSVSRERARSLTCRSATGPTSTTSPPSSRRCA